jgi:hypothetical protein
MLCVCVCVCEVTFKNRVFVPGINLFILKIFLSSLISAFTFNFKIELRQSLCGTGVRRQVHTHTHVVPVSTYRVLRYML